MSQALAAAAARRPAGQATRAAKPARPTLRIVAPPEPRGRHARFAALCIILLVLGLMAVLAINTSLAQGSFQLHDLQQSQRDLRDQEQALRQDIARQSAPDALAQRAKDLGMVPAGAPVFVEVPQGKILGVPQPARPPAPRPTSAPGRASTPRSAPTSAPTSRTP